MTLIQQFLIISTLPLSFLLMIVYLWRSGMTRRHVMLRWSATLVAAAAWSSNVLRFYGGITFPVQLVFTWGIISTHIFGLVAIGILLVTSSRLAISRKHASVAVGMSAALWLLSFALDASIWKYRVPDFQIADQVIRYFDIWVSVWISSWLLPIIAAWILTQQVNASFPASKYRNQVRYWLLVLALFFIGGVLASIRQPDHPVWQELGVLTIILALFTGTISIANSQLPDLQLALRQIFIRLSGSLMILGLTWAMLQFIVQGATNLPAEPNPNLLLTIAAALFAAMFTLIYWLVNAMIQRLFVSSLAQHEEVLVSYREAISHLPEPAQMGQLFLNVIQANLEVDDAWLWTADDGMKGRMILRPLAGFDEQSPEMADFDNNSPFVTYLRQNSTPLVQYDIDALSSFDEMTDLEKSILSKWQRVLYIPLHVGEHLVGVIALGAKYSGESYEPSDFDLLESLAAQFSPLLAQAKNLATLRQINDHLFQQNQMLARKNQHLTEMANLQAQFIALISPDLRQPFIGIDTQLQQLEEGIAENNGQQQLIANLNQQINKVKVPIENLIAMSTQLQARDKFQFQTVYLDDVVQEAMRKLKRMAEARRVRVEFEPDASLPPVLGDEEQLQEAVRHLLHNAIKFNKIEGMVKLEYGSAEGLLCLRVIDTGVGIPQERLETIWDGFVKTNDSGRRGIGMGLALTRYIVGSHGGNVKAQSTYGSGSVFSIYLPVLIEE